MAGKDFSAVDTAYAKLGDDIVRLKAADNAVVQAEAEKQMKEAALAAAQQNLQGAADAYVAVDSDVEQSARDLVAALTTVDVTP